MRADVKKDINVILEISASEAAWLMNLLQNPIPAGIDIKNENETDYNMRSKFFNTLSNIRQYLN